MQVLLDSSTSGFNFVLLIVQDLPFQSLLKAIISLEDVMSNVFIFKKERLNSFWLTYFLYQILWNLVLWLFTSVKLHK